MGKTLKKKTLLRKRSQKKKKTLLRKRSQKKKRKKGKRKSKNYKMRGGHLIIRGNPGARVPTGGPDTPPPLTNNLSYPPWFHVWGSGYGSTSVLIRFRDINNQWRRVYLYGTSIPNQTHGCDGIVGCRAVNPGRGVQAGSRMYRTMGYFMYGKGVNKWISLQACGDPATAGGHPHRDCLNTGQTTDCCQGNPNAAVGSVSRNIAKAENHTWKTLKNLSFGGVSNAGDNNIEMLDILITDMTVGRISSWIRINALRNFWNPINSSVFHCLAGWGRTGTVFLFYILRNELRQANNYLNLYQPWLGQTSSIQMYNNVGNMMVGSIRHHCCHQSNADMTEPLLHNRVTQFPLNEIYNEVMEIGNANGDRFCGNLLISRINTIIIMTWYYIYMEGIVPVGGRGGNWNLVYLYYQSTSPNWIGAQPAIFTRDLVFSQYIVIDMANFFQPGGLPINPAVQQPLAPVGYGLIPLINLTNHFGIRF